MVDWAWPNWARPLLIGSLNSQDMISFMITTGSLNNQDMTRILKLWGHDFSGKQLRDIYCMDIMWCFCGGSFRWWERRSFIQSKSWWKDDIYWLLRSSCFELFGNGKYGLFSTKKLMERWYLRGLFELSMILQDLENTVTAKALSQHWFSFILKIIGLNVQLLQVCLSIIHPRILSFSQVKVSLCSIQTPK